jgi:ferric-dicitrate binding protein FerR (iron transport regulator)
MSVKLPSNDPQLMSRNDPGDEGEIEHLLREVGERVQPTPEITQAVHAAVRAEWRTVVAQRTRRKRTTQWSMAAGFAAVAVSALLLFRFSATPLSGSAPIASIVKIQSSSAVGNVQVSTSEGATWRDAVVGEVLAAGAMVRTDSTTSSALDFGKGRSVRLAAGTRFTLLAVDQVRLERGGVYIDASAREPAPLSVQTAYGTVEHLGTQYQVQLAQDRMSISVREGRVSVAGTSGKMLIAANERVVYAEQGEIARETIASHDPTWLWAMQSAPSFDIDNHTLASFLDWVARETGRAVTYATPEVRAQAEKLILRGSVDNLSPDQALRAVLATTQFVHADTDTVIQISR